MISQRRESSSGESKEKNALLKEKMTPSLHEHALRLGQEILSHPEIKAEFQTALAKIYLSGFTDYSPPGLITLCYEKSKKPYLAWVDKFVENLQSHLQQAGIYSQSIYDVHDGDMTTYFNGINKSKYVLLIGTEALFETNVTPMIEKQRRLVAERIADNKLRTLSILISGDSFPEKFGFYQEWQNNTYFQNLYQLLPVLFTTKELAFLPIWKEFLAKIASHRLVLETGLDENTVASIVAKEDKKKQIMQAKRIHVTRSLFGMAEPKNGKAPETVSTGTESRQIQSRL